MQVLYVELTESWLKSWEEERWMCCHRGNHIGKLSAVDLLWALNYNTNSQFCFQPKSSSCGQQNYASVSSDTTGHLIHPTLTFLLLWFTLQVIFHIFIQSFFLHLLHFFIALLQHLFHHLRSDLLITVIPLLQDSYPQVIHYQRCYQEHNISNKSAQCEAGTREGKCRMLCKWFRGFESVMVCLGGSAFIVGKRAVWASCDEHKGQGSAGQSRVAGQAQTGTVGKQSLHSSALWSPCCDVYSFICIEEEGIWVEWVYNTCDLIWLQGLGGFPDNPWKSGNNKQDWQPGQKYTSWFEAAE